MKILEMQKSDMASIRKTKIDLNNNIIIGI